MDIREPLTGILHPTQAGLKIFKAYIHSTILARYEVLETLPHELVIQGTRYNMVQECAILACNDK